jgi:predicted transcriptional regulator
MKRTNQLTKAETVVMNILWSLPESKGFVTDILEAYDEPKPAYTTLSTFLKILTEKGYVSSELVGKKLLFHAAVSKDEYLAAMMKETKDTFFKGSFMSLISFFVKREKISEKEMDELIDIIKNQRS